MFAKGTVISSEKEIPFMLVDDLSLLTNLNKKILSVKGDNWELYIDASTTCTGLFVYNEQLGIKILIDVERGNTPKDMFNMYLESIINTLLRNSKLKFVLVESPIMQGNKHTVKVLNELRAFLKDIVKTMFRNSIDIKDIPPNVWKSEVIDKSKGKGRYNVKRCIAEDIVDKMPELEGHFNRCTAKDYDSFDAVGMMIGYRSKNYSCGEVLNFSELTHNHKSYVIPVRIRKEEDTFEFSREFVGKFPSTMNDGFEIRKYNDKYPFYKNIKFASNEANSEVKVLEINDDFLDLILCNLTHEMVDLKDTDGFEFGSKWVLFVFNNRTGCVQDINWLKGRNKTLIL